MSNHAGTYTTEEKRIMKDGQDNNLSLQKIQGNLADEGYNRTLLGIAGTMWRLSASEPEVFNPVKARAYRVQAMQVYTGSGKNERRGGNRNYILSREARIDKIIMRLTDEDIPIMGYDIGDVSFSDGTLAMPIIGEDGKSPDDSYMSTARDYIKILFNGSIALQITGLIARIQFSDTIDAVIEKENNNLLVKPNERNKVAIEDTKIFIEAYYRILTINQIKTI